MAYCRICHTSPVKAAGVVCDSCAGKIYDRSKGRPVDEDHPAVREFDSEMEKYGYTPSSSSQKSNQSGCAVLVLAIAAIPAAVAVLGVIRLVA